MTNEELIEENKRLESWIDDLQSGMFINCVYCGHRYGPDDKNHLVTMRKALEEHIAVCPKHPLSKAHASLSEKDREIADLKAKLTTETIAEAVKQFGESYRAYVEHEAGT